jgi:predicted enzyme related to lactoylglutathione lyase
MNARIGNIIYPVGNIENAVGFYSHGLGLAVKFTDGDRFAALDGGGVTLALTGSAEDLTGGTVAASFKVPDVPAAVGRLTGLGAELVRGPESGPHEVRAVLRDPAGHLFILYAPGDDHGAITVQ